MQKLSSVGVSSTNAALTVTVAAVAGMYLHVVGLTVSASDAPTAGSQVEVRDNGVAIDKLLLPNAKMSPLMLGTGGSPIYSGALGTAVSLYIPALGAGVISAASLRVVATPSPEWGHRLS